MQIQSNNSEDNLKKLTDGLPGYKNNYHQGWYLSSKDAIFTIPLNQLNGKHKVEFNFLNHKKHRFLVPAQIEFWSGNKLLQSYTSEKPSGDELLVKWTKTIDLTDVNELEIRLIIQGDERSSIALDEVRILKIEK